MPADLNPLEGVPCRDCGVPALRIEWRTKLAAKPVGSFSLAGAQPKVAATGTPWPWAVCDHCGGESEGKSPVAGGDDPVPAVGDPEAPEATDGG